MVHLSDWKGENDVISGEVVVLLTDMVYLTDKLKMVGSSWRSERCDSNIACRCSILDVLR